MFCRSHAFRGTILHTPRHPPVAAGGLPSTTRASGNCNTAAHVSYIVNFSRSVTLFHASFVALLLLAQRGAISKPKAARHNDQHYAKLKSIPTPFKVVIGQLLTRSTFGHTRSLLCAHLSSSSHFSSLSHSWRTEAQFRSPR